ncbi:MAG: YjjG family noncanonical pyrimidine nucleotidase [Bacteroidaceae bacterium]|nr:YjjG family noncanonical pyrimidine nucleotidase [Bacteroidaceae bacterium]
MKKYNTLFIDLDDTLFDFTGASREAFHETYDLLRYERFFSSFDHFLALYEPRNKELWQEYNAGKINKAQLNKIRYNYPLEAVGYPDEELGARFGAEALGRIPHKNMLLSGALELLEYFAPKYRMFILSNGFVELQSQKMATTGLTKYFERVILSEEIGVNKPDPALFEYALKVSGANKCSTLMIGDAFESDIVGAANAGLDQMFLNRKGEKNLSFSPTFEVSELYEMREYL